MSFVENLSSAKIAIGITSTIGIVSLLNAIRKHYQRLNKKYLKPVNKKVLDTSSEIVELKPENNQPDKIPEQILEKMVEKIKNNTIHTLCICIDKFNEMKKTKHNFPQINNEVKPNLEDEIIIEEDKNIEIGDKVNPLILPKVPKNEDEARELSEIIATMDAKVDFLPDFERGLFEYHSVNQGSANMSSYQILDWLVDTEKNIISSFKYSVEDYQKNLKANLESNKKLKDSVTIMNLFFQGLDNKELFNLRFSQSIIDNYIKAISNIYFVNLRKTSQKFKKDVIDDTNKNYDISNPQTRSLLKKLFNDTYKQNLKETRNQVAEFFGFKKHEVFDVPIKTILRIYPFYLEKTDPIRMQYVKLTETVNKLIDKLEQMNVASIFVDPKHPKYSETPQDKIYDFELILKSLNKNKDEKSDLLKTYNEKYLKGDQDEEVE